MKMKILLCAVLCSSMNLYAQKNFVYTNDDNAPNTVSAFQVDAEGSLSLITGSPFLTGGVGSGGGKIDPGKITTARVDGRGFLYAGNTADGTISGFRVDPRTGRLDAVPGSPFPALSKDSDPALASSPSGEFLFASDDLAPEIHVFRISKETGTLTQVAGSPFNPGEPAQSLKVSPSGRFLAVGLENINAVGIFAIGKEGRLTQIPGSPFPTSGTPTAIDIDCHSNRLFVSNTDTNLIDVFHMAEDGALTPAPHSPFPSGGSSSLVTGLTLNPDNRFLFTSNSFSSTVSSLAVEANGALRPVTGSPFGADSFVGRIETTRAGKFVYISLFANDAVDGWSIDANSTLTPVPGHPFFAGQSQLGQSSMATFPAPSCSAE
jgi:6-phosphogluconolactonase